MKWPTLYAVIICLITTNGYSQSSKDEYECYYKVGVQCPDFAFDSVENFSKKHVVLKDFLGKWLILDFWHKGCIGCIKSFPKTSQQQKEFKDNIQFLSIGLQDREGEARPLWRHLQKKLDLQMPAVFDSVIIPQIIEGDGMPFLVIVDPQGVVQGSTWTLDGIDLNELTLQNKPKLPDFYREKFLRRLKHPRYDESKPYLVNGNGGNDSNFQFRSLLTQWTPGESSDYPTTRKIRLQKKITILGAENLGMLYSYAYFGMNEFSIHDTLYYGKYWPVPIVEVYDSSLFISDISTGQNIYSYSLTVPPYRATLENMMRIMQADLNSYFGYKVRFETRKMPYWRLTATDKARKLLKLDSKASSKKKSDNRVVGYDTYRTDSVNTMEFIGVIARQTQIHIKDNPAMPIVNETGLEKIRISMDYKPFDYDSVLISLRKNGLDLVKGERDIKVLVISD